ncbi:outer membrane beta-barrel protein [Vibrio agarivorans]|uniref:Outer membrane beta-barrel protein n=1 Tax=Vibrio agarivorans TaxID=153622 RepID=A0ABT7XWS0_9VIBR|nr:outer membrane beta-barrel protein [Vibrio agarivorans]MDN2480185.1 outer membrane beta-barrel protein [Vibrio agarivorans]
MKNSTLILITALLAAQAQAGEFSLTLGGMHNATNTSASLGIPILGAKLEVDGESDLDLTEKSVSPYIKAEYRFNDYHSVYADWRSLHRHSSANFSSKSKHLLGSKLDAHAKLDLTLDLDIARIGYAYRFVSSDSFNLDAMFGIHLMSIKSEGGVTAGVHKDDKEWFRYNKKANKNTLAPLPNIGLRGSYQVTPNINITSHLQAFMLSTRLYDGHLLDANIGLEYQLTDSLSVNASYNHYEVAVEYGDSLLNSQITMEFSGPMLSLEYQF